LREYSAEKGFIYIENEHNLGAAGTFNKLVFAATGEYISLIGSDDWMEPDKIAHQVTFLQNTDYDAVVSPVIKYFQETDSYEKQQTEELEKVFEQPDGYIKMMYSTDSKGAMLQSGLWKSEAVRAIEGFKQGYKSDDWLFTIRFLQAGFTIGFLNEHNTYYRIHNANSFADALYCLNELELPVIRDFIPKEYQKGILSDVYATAAQKFWYQNRYKDSFVYQRKSLHTKFDMERFVYFTKLNIRAVLKMLKILK
jgi:GT2 family glycosyltransferase